MMILGSFFFVIIPLDPAGDDHRDRRRRAVAKISQALDVLAPGRPGTDPGAPHPRARPPTLWRSSCSLRWPSSSPSRSRPRSAPATIVGERERGTGEFLAHSPAGVREIYSASSSRASSPATSTTAVGFGAYSLIVNLTVGPEVGGWFFPTFQWWVMILWVLPPFLAICLSLVLRLVGQGQARPPQPSRPRVWSASR